MRMDKKVIFLGPLFPASQEGRIKSIAKRRPSAAPNVFQCSLLSGLSEQLGARLSVVNVLPVGTWPRGARALIMRGGDWKDGNISGHEVGCVNLPFVKQYTRAAGLKRYLKKVVQPGAEIVMYSLYMPFMKAVCGLKDVKVTAIVTDLPEYYDLQKTSALHRALRGAQNKLIYKLMGRIDRFVVLTEQMKERLGVGERPCMRMEGLFNESVAPEADEVDAKAVLYTGTLNYRYGIKNLLDAFALLDDKDAKLWICGGGEAAAEIAERAKADERIKFFGFCSQEEVARLRAAAGILVNPRTNEGEYTKYSFPSKTMEYMASGKPVVMYKLDGVPAEYDEFLNYADGANAVQGLKDALEKVMTDGSSAAKERAMRAREFVLKNKNSNYQAQRLIRFLCEAKAKNNRGFYED